MYVTSLPPDLVCIGQILLPLHLTKFGLEQPAAQVPGCFLTKLDIVRGKKKEEEKKKEGRGERRKRTKGKEDHYVYTRAVFLRRGMLTDDIKK